MITADGYFDWMKRDPGPRWKTNGGRNGGKGIIPHSAEGWRKILREMLFDDKRRSWHASILTDDAFQHYSIWEQCWTSGSGYPNNNYFAAETEGIGPPFNEFQTQTWIRIGRELSALQGWKARRPLNSADKTASCMEHNECTRFGSLYTSCPSGRIPWGIIVPGINAAEEDDMAIAELVWCNEETKVYLVGPQGARWIPGSGGGPGPVFAELQKAYGPMKKAMTRAALNVVGVVT